MFPKSCGGRFQSPVNIQKEGVTLNNNLLCSCPKMKRTNQIIRGTLVNNGTEQNTRLYHFKERMSLNKGYTSRTYHDARKL